MRKLGIIAAAGAILLAASLSAAQECSEEVVIETSAGAISMTHLEARFNCCAWVDVHVDQDGYSIDFIEYEMFEGNPCYCLCCFWVEASTSGLAPGDYDVQVWKVFTGPGGVELVGEWVIPVSGESAPATAASYVPCAQTGLVDDETSWGTIKALYR